MNMKVWLLNISIAITLTVWKTISPLTFQTFFTWLCCMFSLIILPKVNIYQFSSVAQLCLTLCNPMNHSRPGLPVHHQLLKFTQTHVHWVGDAIQPSHPCHLLLLPPSIFPSIRVFSNESVLRTWGQSIGVSASTSVLPMNTQDCFPLGWTGWIFLQSKGLSRVFSNTTVQKHQFFGAQLSL